MYHGYVCQCVDGTLYTGYASDVKSRMETHNNGTGARYTRSRRPVNLLYSESFETRSEAMSFEAKFKKKTRQKKLEYIINNNGLSITLAKPFEKESVLQLLLNGQKALAEAGVDQWQNGYPNLEVVQADIENGDSYVIRMGDAIVATFVCTKELDPSYENADIYPKSTGYGSLHRIAVSPHMKGIGLAGRAVAFCIEFCRERNFDLLRCDTHEHNKSMQKMLTKNGFCELGKMTLVNGEPRIGFEMTVNP